MNKHKWFAAFLNLVVPGLGTAYGGNTRKAVGLYALYIALVIAWKFVAYTYVLFIICLAAIILFWVYAVISGYRDAQKNMERSSGFAIKAVIALGIHCVVVAFIAGFLYSNVTPINFAKIPTPSMDPGLKVGDRLAYTRTASVDRNDVTLFYVPYDGKTMYAQRCIGLPGDSLKIENAIVFANTKPLNDIPVKYQYLVKTNGADINPRILASYHISEYDLVRVAHDSHMIFLTEQEAADFRKLKSFQSVELSIASKGQRQPDIFPRDLMTHDWNTDFYGPLYIPKKGDRIRLTSENIATYLDAIKSENDIVELYGSGLSINGRQVAEYEFKQNYYFMIGDNRHNSL